MLPKKMLIANRGEIACRIAKTAHKMQIKTVAVYSDADINSLHVKYCDEAIYIGPSPPNQSYLNIDRILDAIHKSGSDTVHPGYGFLSENSNFAQLLEKNNINFIGPPYKIIRNMGNKIRAKTIAKTVGMNIIPGSLNKIYNFKDALKIANNLGYPVIFKAVSGGGGKGIKIVKNSYEVEQSFVFTQNIGQNYFNDGQVIIEKFILNPRHIEIQILADKYGNIICLGERDCSIQRHNQKIIEETPSIFINHQTRDNMYTQSLSLAKKLDYVSAGTVEFILDNSETFYFLEMNPRLQVEHAITELTTGIDIVEQMILISSNKKLSIKQQDVTISGHAIETRLYAEDTKNGFLPSTGRITHYCEPETNRFTRIDSGISEGSNIDIFYDSMIAKIVTYDTHRLGAIRRMKKALELYLVLGVSNNISLLHNILNNKKFLCGSISTQFVSSNKLNTICSHKTFLPVVLGGAFIFMKYKERSYRSNQSLFIHKSQLYSKWILKLNNKFYSVTLRNVMSGYQIIFNGKSFYVTSDWTYGNKIFRCVINKQLYNLHIIKKIGKLHVIFLGVDHIVQLLSPQNIRSYKLKNIKKRDIKSNSIFAPMTGLVCDIKVSEGNWITQSQPIISIEAMKMINTVVSQSSARIKKVHVQLNKIVNTGDILIELDQF